MGAKWSWGWIAEALQAKAQGPLGPDSPVSRVWTDTRTAQAGDLFVALSGKRYDAHAFLKDAHAQGVRHFIVSDPKAVPAEFAKDSGVIVAADTLMAYGDLAKAHRLKFNIPCVVITGSCGKTTVKEMTAHLLGARYTVLKNIGTENNLVGVPKTLFGLDASHQAVVLEIGTSLPGEIARLAEIASPQAAVITQIGAAHLEGLGTLEGIREEKTSLIPFVQRGGVIILNGEDPMLAAVTSGVHRVVRVGTSKSNADRIIDNPWSHEKGNSFSMDGVLYETSLLGRHNLINAALAVTAAAQLAVDPESCRKALAAFRGAPGRLEPKTIEGIHFLDDTYNANPTSFAAALDALRDLKTHERGKGVVCGDMLELGPRAEEWHRQIGEKLAGLQLDFVVAAGEHCRALVDEAVQKGFNPKKIFAVKDSAAAGKLCRELAKPGDLVLVKGSRGMKMEKVFECFITSSIR